MATTGPAFANRSDNACHVVTVKNEVPLGGSQTLDGFTIEGGRADLAAGAACGVTNTLGSTCAAGGGILMLGRATLRNLIVRDNQAVGSSASCGGMYSVGLARAVTVFDTQFQDNAAPVGGGVFAEEINQNDRFDGILLRGCRFDGNVATDAGGALAAGTMLVANSSFTNNRATGVYTPPL